MNQIRRDLGSILTRQFTGVAAFAALSLAGAQLNSQQPALADFDSYVAQAVADWNVPGLSIAVVKDGEIVFAQGYGVRSLSEPQPVTTQTLFAIGSTTKAMTAAALGMLVDEGKLGWDDPVTEHLPWFQLSDPWVTREITVRDLLTHRAGLGNADFLWYEQENSTADILQRVRLAEPAYSMRAGFVYQNIMYAAAGEVVAAVGGMPWADFIQARILDPLMMSATVPTARNLEDRPNYALPHYTIDDSVRVIDNASVDAVAAAGSVWSSVDDMAQWIRMLLREGEAGNGQRLLNEATVHELFSPQTIIRSGFYPTARLTNPHWTTYGLGWFQADYRGRAVDFHTGSIDGMVAIVGLIRDENLGVCVLANLDHAEVRHALMYRVFDLYDEGPVRDWSAELMELYSGLRAEAEARRARIEAERVEGTSPSVDLAQLVGTYSEALYGTVDITIDDGQLRLRYGPGLQGPLEHWNHDTFRVRWDAAWRGTAFVSFGLGRAGDPVSLEFNGAKFNREHTGAN